MSSSGTTPITQADLARSLKEEPVRHVVVEVHDDNGNDDNSEPLFAVLFITDTFVRFIEERAAILKSMHDQLTGQGEDLASNSNYLDHQFDVQAGFVQWGYELAPHEIGRNRQTFVGDDFWDIVINSRKEAKVMVSHENGSDRSTGIIVDDLSKLGHTVATSYVAREGMSLNLANRIAAYFNSNKPEERSVPHLEPWLLEVHEAIREAQPNELINFLDDIECLDDETDESQDDAVVGGSAP